MIPAHVSLALPTLPAPAYRRTYFAGQLKRKANELFFGSLLRQLAPEKYTRLKFRTPQDCYQALLDHVGTLFPIYEPDLESFMEWRAMEMEEDDPNYVPPNPLDEARDFGIPVAPRGLDEEWLYRGRGQTASPALALVLMLGEGGDDHIFKDMLRPYLAQLNPILERTRNVQPNVQQVNFRASVHPPKGRAWSKPWDGLPDLWNYCGHNTGFLSLDYTSLMVDEGGGNPEWNLDEIKAFAAEWKIAKPVWERIESIRTYIDADPHERLPLLLRLLTGDEDAHRALSRPKRSKTLAQIWK